MTAQDGWQVLGESGEHGTISPREPRPLDLPTKHSDLMTKGKDLGVLRGTLQARSLADAF
ncbi:hypothetical protein [Streptomyces sp. DASNCL29]|uniref:hypothetical protein n=1 Tax=Streptomyces sp. DASNCL29 TaxID=2583819 RepID=UPI00110FEE79|nr:hypothetical protein [Streptomyces sp. DASNCL29]TMU98487.1 hypothetical protein FGK60_12295 [Streptomyces sp. DASNCL29]